MCACGCGRDWHARVQGWKQKASEAQTYADELAVDAMRLAGELGVAEGEIRRLRAEVDRYRRRAFAMLRQVARFRRKPEHLVLIDRGHLDLLRGAVDMVRAAREVLK